MDKDTAIIVVAILAFVSFSIPVVRSLWNIYSIREAINSNLLQLSSRIDLNVQRLDSLDNQQLLLLNQLREVIDHTRTRSQNQEEKLDHRLRDCESYLEKTTNFTRRV